jgi:hypothetical protein
MSAANVINRVLATARPVTSTVPDALYGYGLVNAYDALVADVPLVDENPLGSIDEWVVIHRRQEGNPIVVPLGPTTPVASDEQEPARSGPLPLDTQMATLPYLITGAFGIALAVVVITGVVLVFGRWRNR